VKNFGTICLSVFFGILCTDSVGAYILQNKHREFNRTTEKEIRVNLDVSFGSITLERGEGNQIAVVDYDEEETDKKKLYISYEVSEGIGTLHIRLKESTHFWGDDDNDNGHRRHLDIRLTDNLPISFEIEFGAGTGEIDLTDLQIKEFNMSTGASSVTMKCNKPNTISANDISIESGVSKFTATDLGNLNFRNLKFSGGVGSYKLDFNGKYRQSAEVQIEVGLGSINISVPTSLPAKLVYDDHWLSSFHIDDDFEEKHNGEYETEGFRESSKGLTIRMEAGLGSVRVHRK
jgi:hypothetical protein